jgi:hypothetical protein
MTRFYAALPRPFALASGRPVQPGETIPAKALMTIPPADGEDGEPTLAAHDQRLLDEGHLVPADDEPSSDTPLEATPSETPEDPDTAPGAPRRRRRPTTDTED